MFYLYRHFDENGLLLYVGMSANPVRRTRDHAGYEKWFSEIREIKMQPFESRSDALENERQAILIEKPKFNVYGQGKTAKSDDPADGYKQLFRDWGRQGGKIGGPARNRKLSKKRRAEIARLGGLARAANRKKV
jgi:predicted GIY-YIG superfamily endonuclease